MISRIEALARDARRLRSGRRLAKHWPALLFFTDPVRTPDPVDIISHLPRGSAVVYRAFGAPTAVEEGRRVARAARRRGLLFFVGADSRLAAILGADGLHLPERESGRRGQNAGLSRRFRLTAAVHSEAAIRRARHAGIQALIVSTVFPSQSPSAGRPKGPRTLARLVRLARLPTYALGGVNTSTIRHLKSTGAVGVAAIGAFEVSAASSLATTRT
jgi:thiamine-phosphate pyrophosphorylase